MACVASCSDRPESSFEECIQYQNMQDREEELGKFVTTFINSIVKTAVMETIDTPGSDEERQKLEQIDSHQHQDLTQDTSHEGKSDIEDIINEKGRNVRRTKSEELIKSEAGETGPERSAVRKRPRDEEIEGAKTASSATDEATKTRVSSCDEKELDPSKAEGGGIGDKKDPENTMPTLQRVRFPIEKFDHRGRMMIQASLATSAALNRAIRDAASRVSNEPDETKRVNEFLHTVIMKKMREKQEGRDKTPTKDNDSKADNKETKPKVENAGATSEAQQNEMSCVAQEEEKSSKPQKTKMHSKATQVEMTYTVSDVETICNSGEQESSCISIKQETSSDKKEETCYETRNYEISYKAQEEENSSAAKEKETSNTILNAVAESGGKSVDVTKEVSCQQNEQLTIVKMQSKEEQKEDGESENISSGEGTEEFEHLDVQEDETGYVFVRVHGFDPSKKEEEELEEKAKSLSIQRILKKLFPSLTNVGPKKDQNTTSDSSTSLLDSKTVSENEFMETQKTEQNKGKGGSNIKKGFRNLTCCFSRKQQQID